MCFVTKNYYSSLKITTNSENKFINGKMFKIEISKTTGIKISQFIVS